MKNQERDVSKQEPEVEKASFKLKRDSRKEKSGKDSELFW